MTKPILLNSSDVADYLAVTRRQVQRLAKAGLLPVYGYGPRGVLYFRKADVNRTPLSVG